jgi:hypothetical protein
MSYNIPKLLATKNSYKNASLKTLMIDLENYKLSLKKGDYRNYAMHVEELKILERELNKRIVKNS